MKNIIVAFAMFIAFSVAFVATKAPTCTQEAQQYAGFPRHRNGHGYMVLDCKEVENLTGPYIEGDPIWVQLLLLFLLTGAAGGTGGILFEWNFKDD